MSLQVQQIFIYLLFSSILPKVRGGVFGFFGDPACPCVKDLKELYPIDPSEDLELIFKKIGDFYRDDIYSYGAGCMAHDVNTPACDEVDCSMIFPRPLSCDKSWCQRPWCYVDPTNCQLLNRRSVNFEKSGRFYSYATCGGMDLFTKENRIAALEGRVLNVAFNANSGGWLGAYSTEKQHFKGPIELWSGPVVDFIKEASYRGKFTINITSPPDYLRNKSDDFFGGTSMFDFCVYATSLGYLDMCVAQYTITDIRASTTDFMIMDSSGMYLIVQQNTEGEDNMWELFLVSVGVIFQPFTAGTWIFMLCFVIPTFAALFVVHEYGRRGSTFPSEEKVIVLNSDGTQDLKMMPIPRYLALVQSLYHVLISASQVAWSQPIVTAGGKLNLLGVAFFFLTIIASYTANLAALLTRKTQIASISGLDEAISKGYRFCCERKNMESIVSVVPNLDKSMFVVDPVDLGGDGEPGFTCSQCNSRQRVFDMLDPIRADNDDNYCHAAIAPEEDLDVLLADGKHCELTVVGTPLQFSLTGFPIFEEVSPALLSFFLRLKNEGLTDQVTLSRRPVSKCQLDLGGEGSALSITQLSGIWLVSFTFAFLGIIATCIMPYWDRRQKTIKLLHKRDQNGEVAETLSMDDDRELLRYSLKQITRTRSTPSLKGRLIMRSTELLPEVNEAKFRCGSIQEGSGSTHDFRTSFRGRKLQSRRYNKQSPLLPSYSSARLDRGRESTRCLKCEVGIQTVAETEGGKDLDEEHDLKLSERQDASLQISPDITNKLRNIDVGLSIKKHDPVELMKKETVNGSVLDIALPKVQGIQPLREGYRVGSSSSNSPLTSLGSDVNYCTISLKDFHEGVHYPQPATQMMDNNMRTVSVELSKFREAFKTKIEVEPISNSKTPQLLRDGVELRILEETFSGELHEWLGIKESKNHYFL